MCRIKTLLILSYFITFCSGEAGLFEEAINKYGKDFSDIQKDFVSSHKFGKFHKFGSLLYKCFRLAKDLNSFLASLEKHLKYY